ncbi:MAG TPA: P22 phage major capsid protein family protein [Marmoricola sp.]|nr:P22 phage major capsid protein family protein [Marmoricola sp.]
MAISNFRPTIWSASLLTNLRDQLVYGGLCNRNYEGDIANAGDKVNITSFTDPSTRAYTKNGTISWDLLTDATQQLVIDQSDYFAFKVDDIDRRQALGGFIEETTLGAAYNLAADSDTYVAGLMSAGAGTDLGDDAISTATGAYDLLVELRTALTRSKTPSMGRWVVVPPEMYAKLLQDDRFIRADASGTTSGLRNGQVGRAAGFDVIESNTVPDADADGAGTGTALEYTVIAGHAMATTFAQQISKVKAVDLQDTFGEGVKGLHLYGAKVVRGDQLAKATVTVS